MKSSKTSRRPALTPKYVSPNQLTICGFETPFDQLLTRENRWVKLSQLIPWDKIVGQYDHQFKSTEGREPISGRIILGAVIIKHMLNLTDRETVLQIQENMFMQYFLGFGTFTNDAPFSPSLFVAIRERLSLTVLSSINEIIITHCFPKDEEPLVTKEAIGFDDEVPPNSDVLAEVDDVTSLNSDAPPPESIEATQPTTPNQGKLLMDATAVPQNITFPTDLKLLNASRIKSEEIIDLLYNAPLHGAIKVRTYRENARKDFLNTAKKKHKTTKEIYKANGSQLRYLKRNLQHIVSLLEAYKTQEVVVPLKAKQLAYLEVIRTVYTQQQTMYETNTKSIENRIVNIHQPHVRPIVRGKEGKKVEFGSKLQVSLVNGFSFIDKLSWDNFNEGGYLMDSVNKYKTRFGYYPSEVLADQIYCTRENRRQLKLLDIKLCAKPLGRPSKTALSNHVSPGERNPIEGKFGQGKVAYGLDNIKAKLQTTSESWIATIALVLNLVNLARLASLCFLYQIIKLVACKFDRPKFNFELMSRPYLRFYFGYILS
jgi:transposase, IS5 family